MIPSSFRWVLAVEPYAPTWPNGTGGLSRCMSLPEASSVLYLTVFSVSRPCSRLGALRKGEAPFRGLDLGEG